MAYNKISYIIAAIILLVFLLQFSYSSSIGGVVNVNNAPISVSISPTTDSFIVGNTETWTATVIPGTPPYSYTWNIYYYNGVLLSTTTYSGNAYTQNQFSYKFNLAQIYYANVVVVDSIPSTATSTNSVIKVCYPTCSNGKSTNPLPPTRPIYFINNDNSKALLGLVVIYIAIGLSAYLYVSTKPKQKDKKEKREKRKY